MAPLNYFQNSKISPFEIASKYQNGNVDILGIERFGQDQRKKIGFIAAAVATTLNKKMVLLWLLQHLPRKSLAKASNSLTIKSFQHTKS